jgi:hypothetical protein
MLGIAVSAILFYLGVYLPLALLTRQITVVPDTWLEIVTMVVGANVVVMIIGHYLLKDRTAKAAREAELYGSTTGEEPWLAQYEEKRSESGNVPYRRSKN